jgi:hypothetical protein
VAGRDEPLRSPARVRSRAGLFLGGVALAAIGGFVATCSTRGSSAHDGAPALTSASASPSATTGAPDPIDALRPFEEATRASFDFEHPPSAETGLGADPWAIRRVPSGWVGILRGRSAIVLLDDELHELARLPAPRSPTGLALRKNGEILVVGELASSVTRYAVRGKHLEARGAIEVPGVMGLRDVAVSPGGVVWALDERGGRVVALGTGGDEKVASVVASLPVGHGAVQVLATAKHVVVNAVTEHTLVIFTTDAAGAPLEGQSPLRITHDGPMWGFDARETPSGLVVAAGGVEDHPLDRREGFFGYVDSFAYAYRVHDASFDTLAVVNVSAQLVLTPKAIAIESSDDARVDLLVTGYGSASGVRIGLHGADAPSLAPVALVPGVRALDRDLRAARGGETIAMADPLLDAWVLADARGVRVVPVPEPSDAAASASATTPPRSTASRLGEALFFTSLMAPRNSSEGSLSRFTCETCHFEGYVDGRTHHTGRGDVHATTKPLVGLVGNRPYFSRALDPDLSTISHAEFRVAGAGSGTDPFFAVDPSTAANAWLAHLGVRDHERIEPLELRRSLLRFLVDFSHRPNSAVVARKAKALAFDDIEREGARVFRDRCERCHSARLSADDPGKAIPFDRWEAMVLSEPAPIVWGSAGYRKTGVTPYVADEGARTPSLRRLYKKFPYFTNGSAKSLDDVLDGVRFQGDEMFHANAPEASTPLDDASKRALRAFLELL